LQESYHRVFFISLPSDHENGDYSMRRRRIHAPDPPARLQRTLTPKWQVQLAVLWVSVFALTFSTLPHQVRTVAAAPTQDEKISDSALSQIRSLIAVKLARTPIQQKIDSNLLAAIRVSHGEPVAANAPAVQPDLKIDADGKVLVDIAANVTRELLQQIEDAGGEILNRFELYNAIRARLPLAQIESLAGSADVRVINRATKSETQRAAQDERASRTLPAFAQRANRVRSQLPHVLATLAPPQKQHGPSQFVPDVGVATSAGDVAHAAAAARSAFGVNGTGVKIGVLSDSYNNQGGAATNVATGDLPGPGNPNGFTTAVTVLQDLSGGGTDEGRAMLQIVHDLAPGAQLYFATAFNSAASFASNIQALRNNGCDIVIDDVFYTDESPFQDGIIAQAVNTVTAAGALYFSAAGNSGNLNDGTPGVWEGDFTDSGVDFIFNGDNVGRLHQFNSGNTTNQVAPGGSDRRVDLFWSDPLGQSTNDYDLYILDLAGTNVLRFSDSTQNGTQDPYEAVDDLNVGERIAIVKSSGSARALHVSTGRGRLFIPTSGQMSGHACAVNAFGVAAVAAARANGGAFTGGPLNPIESFSSDGLRRVFYNANGTAITPGNLLFATNGGTVRQKPDIAAADGVATTLPPGSGLNPFFGTSAAAPHAGAIAGLLKAFKPTLTAAQVRTILTSTALDIEAVGVDRDSGVGIVMALQALQAAGPNSGTDTAGLYNPTVSAYFLRNTNSTGVADLSFAYGPAVGWLPLVGDWNGDGVDTIGLYNPATSTFFLRNANSTGVADLSFAYGPAGAGWLPLSGDWNGDGTDTVGLYNPATSTFYLRNTNSTGVADITFAYGPGGAGWLPIVGDWNGDGTDTIGLYNPTASTYFLRNTNSTGVADVSFAFGPAGAGWTPIVGDWNGDGIDTIGLYNPAASAYFLRNANSTGVADVSFSYGPAGAGWIPLVGDWDGL
jgi:hypothetical protein